MKKVILFFICLIFYEGLWAQNQSNMYFSGEMNSWAAGAMSMNDLGVDTWQVTIQSDGDDGSSEFKFRNNNSNFDQNWSRGDAVTLGSKTTWYNPNGGNGNFSETNGKYYTFIVKDVANSNNSEGYIFEFSQTPISINTVALKVSGNALATVAKTITVTLSGTPDNNERVYLRYTNDNWSSSSVVEADPSSSTVDIDIPGQSGGVTVKYYAFTSITGISNSDADLATISFDNNSGNNYSYYVESGNLTISGNAGFRMMASPVSGQVLGDLLTNAWTQGMTGADLTTYNPNVWILNLAGQSWTALSDISGSGTSIAAGEGFLTYIYADNDNDGTDDLPITLSVSGTENSGNVTYPASGSIAANVYGLAGNPYYSTIDWDGVTKNNVTNTVSVWDDASSTYKQWNGVAGTLTDGLIAPFQGFWVQATGSGNGSIVISSSSKTVSAGTFYRIADIEESGSLSLTFTAANNKQDVAWFSFTEDGVVNTDDKDALKLLPLAATSRIVAMSFNDESSLDINNLPFSQDQTFEVPLDVMCLEVEESNFITTENNVTVGWDIGNLPMHIEVILIDQVTGTQINIRDQYSYVFTTQPKGSFSTSYSGPVGNYPVVGETRFSLAVSYDALTSAGTIKMLPAEFALHDAYPNPFNPSTTISFDLPEAEKVSLNVYDLKGALVGTLLNENKVAGTHQYRWTPNRELASGVYLFELKTKNKTRHQKITYIK